MTADLLAGLGGLLEGCLDRDSAGVRSSFPHGLTDALVPSAGGLHEGHPDAILVSESDTLLPVS